MDGHILRQLAPAVPALRQRRPVGDDDPLCPVALCPHHIGDAVPGLHFIGAPAVKGAAVLRHRHNGRRVIVKDAPVVADPQQPLCNKAQFNMGIVALMGVVAVIKYLRHHPHTAAAVQQHHHRLIILFGDGTAVCPVAAARGIEILAAAAGAVAGQHIIGRHAGVPHDLQHLIGIAHRLGLGNERLIIVGAGKRVIGIEHPGLPGGQVQAPLFPPAAAVLQLIAAVFIVVVAVIHQPLPHDDLTHIAAAPVIAGHPLRQGQRLARYHGVILHRHGQHLPVVAAQLVAVPLIGNIRRTVGVIDQRQHIAAPVVAVYPVDIHTVIAVQRQIGLIKGRKRGFGVGRAVNAQGAAVLLLHPEQRIAPPDVRAIVPAVCGDRRQPAGLTVIGVIIAHQSLVLRTAVHQQGIAVIDIIAQKDPAVHKAGGAAAVLHHGGAALPLTAHQNAAIGAGAI